VRTATLNDELHPLLGKAQAALRFAFDRAGRSRSASTRAAASVRSGPDAPQVDLQLDFSPVSYTKTPLAARKLLNPDPFPAFLLSFNPCRPTSRGHLELRSADPLAPSADPAQLSLEPSRTSPKSAPETVCCAGYAASRPLADMITEELDPRPGGGERGRPARRFPARADTVYHPPALARWGLMQRGRWSIARLRVHGTEGLRVIDASIFPNITSGRRQCADRDGRPEGAAMILEDARR